VKHLEVRFLMAVAMVASPVAAQGQSVEERVDAIFAEFDTPHTPGCAMAAMRDGAVRYQRGYGMANLEYGIPITPSSVFHVASVSKQFTAMAVALLVAEGRVSWDDDIRTYVPEVPDFGAQITLRHLVTHTSGIRDQWSLLSMAGWRWEADVVRQEDVLDLTSRQTALNFPVGSEYLYSNTGFTLLAVVVERVTGQTLREFTQERIYDPLGMPATHFHDDHEMIVKNRAYAYKRAGDGIEGLKISIPDFDVVGATSLFTTVEDMARWDRNFYTARVGGQESLDDLHRREVLVSGDTIAYAGGLVHGRYRGLATVGHGGADAGYRSNYLRFPDQRFSVVVLCNFPWSNPGALAQRIADVYLEDAFTEPAPTPGSERGDDIPSAVRSRLVGTYAVPDTDIPFLIVEAEDQLRLVPGAGRGQPLRGMGDGRFETPNGGVRVWLDGGRGQAAAIRIQQTSAPAKAATRLEPAALDEQTVEALVGDYYSAELGAWYGVARDVDSLVLVNRKHGETRLIPVAQDVFRSDRFALSVSRGPGGQIDGFTVSSGRVRKVRFDRRRREGGGG
jgi:CubicO group peptidase (beta-lactamase class C family)